MLSNAAPTHYTISANRRAPDVKSWRVKFPRKIRGLQALQAGNPNELARGLREEVVWAASHATCSHLQNSSKIEIRTHRFLPPTKPMGFAKAAPVVSRSLDHKEDAQESVIEALIVDANRRRPLGRKGSDSSGRPP